MEASCIISALYQVVRTMIDKMIPPKGIATAIKLTLRGSLILLTGQNFGDFFFGKFFSAKKIFLAKFLLRGNKKLGGGILLFNLI